MQMGEPATTVIFVSTRRPEQTIEKEMEARGLSALWAPSIASAAPLFNSAQDRTVVITELALVDGNWRDLVERVNCLGRLIPIVLVASTSTAELWWDALECGIEDILIAPLSASQLSQLLSKQFTNAKLI